MKLQLPPGPFSAYLFDCDGTIADSMPLHRRSWNQALEKWGCDFPDEFFFGWAGMPLLKTVEKLNQQYGLCMPVQEVAKEKERIYLELIQEIQPIVDVVEHVNLMYGVIPLAVVSGSPRASVIRTLSVLGLLDRFQVIVGAEDTSRGKPNPDPFLRAAELLGVRPEGCLVFEDAEFGIQAAVAAGMSWVKVPVFCMEGENPSL